MRFSLDGEPHNGKAWAHRPDDRHRLCYRTGPGRRHRYPHLHRAPLLRIRVRSWAVGCRPQTC
jgi:hypothetical protein